MLFFSLKVISAIVETPSSTRKPIFQGRGAIRFTLAFGGSSLKLVRDFAGILNLAVKC